MEDVVIRLKNEGVKILDYIQDNDYSKFVRILDLQGNKI